MLARRIIPCLDVADGKVVKGIRFRDHEVVGEIETLARIYAEQGADELVFYDITASADGSRVDHRWVQRVAQWIDIPFCVAGGIDSVEVAREVLYSGADKISVNSPALARPQLIRELADAFGSQSVVIGVDSVARNGDYWVKSHTGRQATQRDTGRRTEDWILEVEALGAGEVVLNCMDQDGVRQGYDVVQLQKMRGLIHVPLIASGGAGATEDFIEVFAEANVSGALAASVFHRGILTIEDVKLACQKANIPIRTHFKEE
jgi:cyclase